MDTEMNNLLDKRFVYNEQTHAEYVRNGYHIFPHFLSDGGLEECCRQVDRMLDQRHPEIPPDAIIGAAAGYGVLWLVFQGFALMTGKHGMGYGDFKLLAALGAWLGWQSLPLVVIIASTGGALVGGTLLATGRMERDTPMPFGPWLAAAGWLALIAGDTITAAYLRYAGLG